VNIYSVPAKVFVTLKFDGEINVKMKIELLNSSGAVVYSTSKLVENKVTINTSNLSSGIYYINGFFGAHSVKSKIVL